MGKSVSLAVVQLSSIKDDVLANIDNVQEIIEEELRPETELLVFPEVWPVGWYCEDFIKSAEFEDDVNEYLSDLAKKHNMNIIGGSYITKKNDKYYNTCRVFNRKGEIIADYDKMHLYSHFDCNEDKYVDKGKAPILVDIDGIKYGLSICYDIRFPEIYRAYAIAGADILVNCAAWGYSKELQWSTLGRARAMENQCYMITLTQTGYLNENEFNLGKSYIYDYNGNTIASINRTEGIINAKLEMDEMYEFRKKALTISDIREKYEVKNQ